ncbi:UNVERIFIED_CONTAM: Copia protein [Sesamum radiatum]|uniref:Copia protein n=1 Tax=Sesamum radiatum TaxID=300843 RepID=A0AAW2QHK6_SESRA
MLGYVVKGQEDKVLKLKRALYGLKQAPRAWNSRIDHYFQNNGFIKCPHEHALYVKKNTKGDILFVCLYVDGLIFTGNNPKKFDDFKRTMAKQFEMTDIGLISYYLDIKLKQRDDGIFILQEGYAKKILKKFEMENCMPMSTPMECGVKLSSSQDEYVAIASCICHPIWLRGLLKELNFQQKNPTEIYVDNKSAIALANNSVFHERSKHIDTKYHFIREAISKKEVKLEYVKSQDQIADIFTKASKFDIFKKLCFSLGMMNLV